jgi:ABC-type amino acid transport/signal transduction systems, periplasmic component/domain
MKHFLAGLISLSLLILGQSASAADCKFKYKTGVNEDSAYFKRESSGQTSGLAWDILQEISRRTGCEFQGAPMNFSRALVEMESSRIDLFAIVYQIPDWSKVAEHHLVYGSDRVILMRQEGAPKTILLSQIMKNKNIKFGNVIGAVLFFSPAEIAQLEKEGRIVEFANGDGAIAGLLSGKVQVLFVSPLYLNFLRATSQFEKFAFAFDPSNSVDVGIYLSKKRMNDSQRLLLGNTIKEMRSDGTIKKILGNYLQPEDLSRYH